MGTLTWVAVGGLVGLIANLLTHTGPHRNALVVTSTLPHVVKVLCCASRCL
jgi:hypothetical protein